MCVCVCVCACVRACMGAFAHLTYFTIVLEFTSKNLYGKILRGQTERR